jgi:hypothetical protein
MAIRCLSYRGRIYAPTVSYFNQFLCILTFIFIFQPYRLQDIIPTNFFFYIITDYLKLNGFSPGIHKNKRVQCGIFFALDPITAARCRGSNSDNVLLRNSIVSIRRQKSILPFIAISFAFSIHPPLGSTYLCPPSGKKPREAVYNQLMRHCWLSVSRFGFGGLSSEDSPFAFPVSIHSAPQPFSFIALLRITNNRFTISPEKDSGILLVFQLPKLLSRMVS